MSIYEALKLKLGRTPTNAELKSEVKRIVNDAWAEQARRGQLAYQKKR